MRSFIALLAPTATAAAMAVTGVAAAADLPAGAPGLYGRPVHAFAVDPGPLRLERSFYTGQPVTVIYNEPGRTPWSVAPDLVLLPLPKTKPYGTRDVYPRSR